MTAPEKSRRVRSVDHAIDILEVMGRAGRAIGVSEIARQTGLSKASVHHLLATMESRRFVMKDPSSPLYKLSWGLYELGSNVLREADLTRIARPFLDQLAVQTGESVLLGILDSDTVLYLDRGEPPAGLRMRANAGRRGPLHATASGKILLAFTNDQTMVERILGAPLDRYTGNTVTDPTALRRELALARQQGYSSCWQEREVGLCSLAVPLHDHSGAVVGSLALAGPATRLTTQTLPEHLVPLQTAGRRIETHLGGAHPAAI